MTIDFDFFETDTGEIVNIYDGDNADAPLIASLYGNYTSATRPPTGYRSTQPSVYERVRSYNQELPRIQRNLRYIDSRCHVCFKVSLSMICMYTPNDRVLVLKFGNRLD